MYVSFLEVQNHASMLSTAVDEYKHVTIKDLKIRLQKNDKDSFQYKDLNMCTSDGY